jgi:uncharacterized NAD(P)/FAD-binding protein YdhS
MKTSLVIVGCGATAISFLHRHLDFVKNGEAQVKTIYVFEQRDVFGCGSAYEPDIASNLLNTKTRFITPFPDRPGDFKNWLDLNKSKWQRAFPDFDAEPDSYAPRPLFGLYLVEQIRAIVRRAAAVDVRVVLLHAEVQDIISKDSGLVVHTNCGLAISASKVFLFCGTLAKKPGRLGGDPRIRERPYPLTEWLSAVQPNEDIGIVGARLSAIDTVIALMELGHRGKVRVHSRSGFFPAVRGTQGRIVTERLSVEAVNKLVAKKGLLELQDLANLFQEELALHDPRFLKQSLSLPTPPSDIERYLEDEIKAASHPRPWQAVLYATNGFIESIWRALSADAQSEFMSKYFGMFMAYRVSIPIENAKRILSYLKDARLEFVAGKTDEPSSRDEGIILRSQDKAYRYDRLIYAIGVPRNAEMLESVLLDNLFRRGMVTAHPMGGIQINAETYKVVSAVTQRQSEIYAVGELTVGQNFFTSALEINARHAYRCAEILHASEVRTERSGLRATTGEVLYSSSACVSSVTSDKLMNS